MTKTTPRRHVHSLYLALFGALVAASAACSSSSDVGAPMTTSEAGAGTGAGNIGDPCPNGSGDCGQGLECAGEDPGGGQCEKPCRPSMDSDCGDTTKYVCNFEGHCYVRCNTTADCKRASQGYVCRADEPARPPIMFCDVP